MKATDKKVLGIDPGSHHLGVGCLKKEGNRLRLLYATIIHAPARDSLFDRLDHISAELKKVLDDLAPDEIAVENIFHSPNTRQAFNLGVARGVAIGACLGRGIKIFEYAPTQVKSVVTGYGRADKEQVRKMVNLLVGTE